MRVLVTGASSFTGLWLVRKLAEAGADVTAICRGSSTSYDGIRRARVKEVAHVAEIVFDQPFGSAGFIDFLNRSEGFAAVCLHHTEVGDFRRPDYAPLDAAAHTTAHIDVVLRCLAERGLQRVLYTGTVFEAGEGDGDRPLHAIGAYGLAKTLCSAIIAHEAATLGLTAIKVTLPSPFGPWQAGGFVNSLIEAWRAGETPMLDHPDRVRDFLPVELMAWHYAALALGHLPAPASGRSNPSGYVENVERFTRRLARALRPRLGMPCRIAKTVAQPPSKEPRRRFNTEPVDGLFAPDRQAITWDRLANWHFREESDSVREEHRRISIFS